MPVQNYIFLDKCRPYHNLIYVTAWYFSQVDARSKHFLVETEDKKDEPAGEILVDFKFVFVFHDKYQS